VKQIMEESVTKKFVHEDSSHIIALCTAIEACLGHMLKRRAAGFLRSDKIAALFTKIGKVNDTTGDVCCKVQEQLQQQSDVSRVSTTDDLATNGWKTGVDILVILIADDCQVRVINEAGSGNCAVMRRPRTRT
ncbi:unnamed protein product, partial [Boreogadus saida]